MKKTPKVARSYCNTQLSDADLKAGHGNYPLDPMANMVTSEHNTGFYEEVTRKDKLTGKKTTGFLERNNYLDRG